MAADELGGRVHHDVGAVLERVAQVGAGQGVVHDEGDLVLVRDGRHPGKVEDVSLGIAYGLGLDRLGVGPEGRPPCVQVVGVIHEGDLDAQLGQRVAEEAVGPAVE